MLRILLVEDNEFSRLFVSNILVGAGYSVVEVNNGQDAVNTVIDGGPFDLIIMDVNLPVMNGLEATKIIREKKNYVPIIGLTSGSQHSLRECYDAGMDYYMQKPVLKTQLLVALRVTLVHFKKQRSESTNDQVPIKIDADKVAQARFAVEAVVISDTKGCIRSVNDELCHMFGYRSQELMGSNVTVLMPEVYAKQHDHYIQKFLRTLISKVIGGERNVTGKKKSGENFNVKLTLSYVDEKYFVAIFEELFNFSSSIVFDENGVIVSTDGSFDFIGYTQLTLKGKDISLLCPKMACWEKCLSDLNQSRFGSVVHIDGHSVAVSYEVTQISQDPVLFRVVLKASIEKEVIVTLSLQGIVVDISSDAKDYFGCDAHEIVGRPLSNIVSGASLNDGAQMSVGCLHKDISSRFVATMHVDKFHVEGQAYFRAVIRRGILNETVPKRGNSAPELVDGKDVGLYSIKRTLGPGYFGEVKLAEHRLTACNVAVKLLRKEKLELVEMSFPPLEAEFLKILNHARICTLYDTIQTSNSYYLIMEAIMGGELFDFVMENDFLNESDARKIMRQLLDAVDYMHRMGVVHRDLKLDNVMMDCDGNIKIIDLGLACYWDASTRHTRFCGSPDYAAPELFLGQEYVGPELDVWSLGVILFILVTGILPFNDSNCVCKLHYQWPPLRKMSTSLIRVVDKIFQFSSSRCSLDFIMEHDWITNDGLLKPVPHHPVEAEEIHIDEQVIAVMEKEMGFPAVDVKHALRHNQCNQFTASYKLLCSKLGVKI